MHWIYVFLALTHWYSQYHDWLLSLCRPPPSFGFICILYLFQAVGECWYTTLLVLRQPIPLRGPIKLPMLPAGPAVCGTVAGSSPIPRPTELLCGPHTGSSCSTEQPDWWGQLSTVESCTATDGPGSAASSHGQVGYDNRADPRFAPTQWETVLLCNDVSHWLGASLVSTLGWWYNAVPF